MDKQHTVRVFSPGISLMRAKDGEEQSRKISGTAIVFDSPTTLWDDGDEELREVIDPSAVPESLLRDSDILLTLFHNPERVLARSKAGQTEGSLTWSVDSKGVHFEAEMPRTADGDMALELVANGDMDGCSFWAYLRREDVDTITSKEVDKVVYTRRVKGFATIRDFTLTPSPAYKSTEVGLARQEARDFVREISGKAADAETLRMEQSWRRAEQAILNNKL